LQKGTGRARFRVEAPLDAIEGSTSGLSGELRFDEASWAEGTGKIRISLTGFTTGLTLRDEDLRDQFFQVDRFPEATFTLTRLDRHTQGPLVPGREGQADAVGTFSLHGKEQPVRIPITVLLAETSGSRELQVSGTFDVPFTEYGIPRPARLFLKLGTVAKVHFEATFRGAPPGTAPVATQAPPPSPTLTAISSRPPRVELAINVARRPEKPKAQPKAVSWEFSFTTPEGRGERLFRDPSAGGEQNALACASCHGWRDERAGTLDPLGHASPNTSLWDSARRSTFWRGFASTPEDAIDLCVRRPPVRPPPEGGGPRAVARPPRSPAAPPAARRPPAVCRGRPPGREARHRPPPGGGGQGGGGPPGGFRGPLPGGGRDAPATGG